MLSPVQSKHLQFPKQGRAREWHLPTGQCRAHHPLVIVTTAQQSVLTTLVFFSLKQHSETILHTEEFSGQHN